MADRTTIATRPYAVTLGGIDLNSLDERIVISEVREVPMEDTTFIQRSLADGDPVNLHRRSRLEVYLTLFLKASDPVTRASLLSQMTAWVENAVQGSVDDRRLTASWRPGLMLQVDAFTIPGIPSLREWNKTFEIVLTATVTPYWQDLEYTKVQQAVKNGTISITPPGQTPYTLLELDAQNVSAPVFQSLLFRVYVDGEQVSYMYLTGFNLQTAEHLVIGYDSYGFMTIKAYNQSALSCRSAGSSDELRLITGKQNDVVFESTRDLNMILRTRGRYY